ncbi:MAG: hypothetical protein ACLQNE_25380 [Thermoguttaceae bacterium]
MADQLVVWGALLAILVAVGVYVLKRIRAESVQNEPVTSELMSKFREIHARGGLSEAEFRNIKTKLSASLQKEFQEIRENGEKG